MMRDMKIPKLAALLSLLAVLGLLLSSCRHVNPRTYVLGPVTCEAQPTKRQTRCDACTKAKCCPEFLACAQDAPCPCNFMLRKALAPSDEVARLCGAPNASSVALASCLDAQCAEDCPADDGRAHHPLTDKPAPEIAAQPIGGEGPRTLAEARGKVVVLEFWATWCGPCKRSFPEYQKLVDRYRGDLAVIAISVDKPEDVTRERVLAVARENGARFSILWDTDLRMEARYTMPLGIPSAFMIDRTGIVRGVHGVFRAEVRAEIEALIKSPASPTPHEGVPPP